MKTIDAQVLDSPPNLFRCLLAGFDSITNHIGLILFPVVFDFLLWVGPHLQLKTIIGNFLTLMQTMPGMNAPEASDMLRVTHEFWSLLAERLNLLSLLRTYPVGVPSLMTSVQPIAGPIGLPLTLDISSIGLFIVLWICFSVLGLVAGTFYYELVSQAALSSKLEWRQAFAHWPRASLQILLLAFFWTAVLLVISLPSSCALTIASVGGMTIARLGTFAVLALAVWIFFPLLLSSHGIFINQRNMWQSVVDSVRLTRMTFASTGMLLIIILFVNEGLDILWRVPGETSWLLMVGVVGHAFVTTGLLATTFIYYRDAYHWVQRTLQQIKLSSMGQ